MILDILMVAKDDVSAVYKAMQNAIATPLTNHSWTEELAIADLKEQFGKLSPNGKLLAKKEIRKAAQKLYADSLRHGLKQLLSSFGPKPVPRLMLERLDYFKQNETEHKRILRDREVTSKQFVVYCNGCDIPHLGFNERRKAERAVSDANRTCVFCGQQTLEITESYSIADNCLRALQQGLWLESLVYDTIRESTDAVWAGQMVESNEIDVISVFADNRILVECKDTTFGQNDFYVTLIKATELEADTVIIVTTDELHPNVLQLIQKHEDDRGTRYQVISSSSAEDIRERLASILEKISYDRVRLWFESAMPEHLSWRRVPVRIHQRSLRGRHRKGKDA